MIPRNASTTRPRAPLTGEIFYDLIACKLQVFDGRFWRMIYPGDERFNIKLIHKTCVVTGEARYYGVYTTIASWLAEQNMVAQVIERVDEYHVRFDEESDAILCYLRFK